LPRSGKLFDPAEGYHVKLTAFRIITVENAEGVSTTEEVDIVIAARGNLNDPAWPEIAGLESFKGKKIHSAAWDQDYDFENKKIGVIGGGSSSIQIVPELQKVEGTQLSCFVRSKVWISNRFGDETMQQLGWDPADTKCKSSSSPSHTTEMLESIP
jgi:cation diffusion facilitator CzcD-associated flavoprotein CzcO